ncbi:PIN domain nuclease [Rhizobium deserti]|uniref:PIN domain nuclease n=1 Tax=Rhizobium deserti TaxID=2547961 RepID=A0A4R5UJY3_9HYPH|nr:PIN domain nuclease [Rhizobium deserti]TDK37191.1 PIN domain nuclease [Rhizobium deserti]
MIVVDSSVWISRLHNVVTPETQKFDEIEDLDDIILGDIVLLEILRGTRDDKNAENVRRKLQDFAPVSMLSPNLAVEAARNYRILRERGRTLSKTPDLIIGTYCIVNGYSLLQRDKDYMPMADHLGLKLA